MFSAGQLMDSSKYDLNPEEIRSDKVYLTNLIDNI